MSEIENNDFIVTKEDGTEESWKLLFYYDNEERNKRFYFVYKEGDEENVSVFVSKDQEELELPTDEEIEEAEEVLEAYNEDPKIAEVK